ncbi:MAG: arylsulfatase [Thioploca sp.]|nr:arylsulfatase [Thioploca sp.]
MMKLKKVVATVCATSAVVHGGMIPLQEAIAQEVKKPNFVTIVIDDMGYSDLGVFGGETSTPNLDQLATDGVILTNFYAGATSSPSRAMLFSGKDHHKAGLGNMRENLRDEQRGQPGYEGVLSLEVLPFPQLLKDNNYRTMMTGKWHLGGEQIGDEKYYPINRGFTDTRAVLLGGGDVDYMINAAGEFITEHHPLVDNNGNTIRTSFYNTNGVEFLFEGVPPGTHSTNYYTDMAIKMLDDLNSDEPFYLNISYLAPHMPLQAPKDLIDKYVDVYAVGWEKIREQRFNNLKQLGYISPEVTLAAMPGDVPAWADLSERQKQFEARRMAVYSAEIELLDQNVGRLVEYLKEIGSYENTVFFVYSDNGAANVGFAKPPHGVTRYESDNLDTLSDAEFEQMLADLGGPTSFLAPNSGWASVSGTPFRNYKGDTFDGGTRGAAFVHYYNARASGIRSNCLYSVMDIAPTILDMAGIQYPTEYMGKPNKPMDGVSMNGIFEGNLVCNPERWIGVELDGVKGIRRGNWKLAEGWNMGGGMGLYNVWDDPFEQNDLSAQNPALYQEMLALYQQYAKENNVIEVNILHLPDLVDPNLTAAKIRGGASFVDGAGLPVNYKADASFKPMTQVSVAGEIRPASEHLGMPAIIYAKGSYIMPGEPELTFWMTENGPVLQEGAIPFKIFSNLPPMIPIPIFEGKLSEATIEVRLGYLLNDNDFEFTLIANRDTPIKIKLTN